MASLSNTSVSNSVKETVLLRKPAPKYSFDGRKLPKLPDSNDSYDTPQTGLSSPTNYSVSTQPGLMPFSSTPRQKSQQKPVAVVGASVKAKSSPELQKEIQPSYVTSESQASRQLFNSKPNVSISSLSEGIGASNSPQSTLDLKPLTVSTSSESPLRPQISSISNGQAPSLKTPSVPLIGAENDTESDEVGIETYEPIGFSSSPLSEQLQTVKEERDKLKAELNAQLQVNAELKRLLVASVGDDLYQRVENLCRDRAQLELDIGGFSKKMSEDYENLDKISIQADMWRSKYLASRVMTEELSSAKAYYSLQCHDSHSALQQLLNERHELRTNLVESYKVLQQVKNAFDPLNTHHSSSLRTTNVLDLSRSCQQLSEAVRFRLLPANVVINVSADVSSEAWQDSVTRAEHLAHEVLSRPMEPDGSKHHGSSFQSINSYGGAVSPSLGLHTRYHPATQFENLTFNCCSLCRGEIHVV